VWNITPFFGLIVNSEYASQVLWFAQRSFTPFGQSSNLWRGTESLRFDNGGESNAKHDAKVAAYIHHTGH
jgi:hypothetical protein